MTTALILAAGLGSRLMPLTRDRPKALVEVAGRPLLGGLIAGAAEAGIEDVVVVTGCLAEKVDAWIDANEQPVPVRTVFNDAYDTLGNAWSVAVAREALEGRDFIKLDGDLVIDGAILKGLDAMTGSSLALDSQGELDDEAMKASVHEGKVTGLGKWLASTEAAGESIGIEKISAGDGPKVFDALTSIVETHPNAYYEDAYHQLVTSGTLALSVFDIGPRKWTEIDCAADLEQARALFPSKV